MRMTVQHLVPALSSALQAIAFQHGYTWAVGGATTTQYTNRLGLHFDSSTGIITHGECDDDADYVFHAPHELSGAIEWLEEHHKGKVVEVKLNDEYTATVTPDGIRVGCTNMPLSVVHQLVEARNEVLK